MPIGTLLERATKPQREMVWWSALDKAEPVYFSLGNAGCGKSEYACLAMLLRADRRARRKETSKKHLWALVGTSSASVKAGLLPLFESVAEECGIPVEVRGDYILGRGWRAKIYGAHDDRAKRSVKGPNFAGGIVDEVTEIDPAYFDLVQRGCRDPMRDRLIITGNPGHPSNWTRAMLWESGSPLVRCTPQFLHERADLTEEDIAQLRSRAVTAAARDTLYADTIIWRAEAGLIYSDWRRAPMRKDWPQVVAGVDVGSANPTAAIYIGTDGKDAQIIAEYWGAPHTRLEHQHAGEIVAMGDQLGCSLYAVDPAADAMEAYLRDRGARVRHAKNPVLAGIHEVRKRFATGTLTVAEGACPEFEREIAGYVWDEAYAQRTGMERPLKINDHAQDACRYGVMALSKAQAGFGSVRHRVA